MKLVSSGLSALANTAHPGVDDCMTVPALAIADLMSFVSLLAAGRANASFPIVAYFLRTSNTGTAPNLPIVLFYPALYAPALLPGVLGLTAGLTNAAVPNVTGLAADWTKTAVPLVARLATGLTDAARPPMGDESVFSAKE
jgi:hypothetical protein